MAKSLTTEEMEEILLDASHGRKSKIKTPAGIVFRKKMDKEVAEIKAKGGVVHVPSEHGSLSDLDDDTSSEPTENKAKEDDDGKWHKVDDVVVKVGKDGKIAEGPKQMVGKTISESHHHLADAHEKLATEHQENAKRAGVAGDKEGKAESERLRNIHAGKAVSVRSAAEEEHKPVSNMEGENRPPFWDDVEPSEADDGDD